MEKKERYALLPSVLLPWYELNKRDLPWRKDRDPYHIWLSEIMLQQTRVEAVKGYYNRFISKLPDIAAVAQADDDLLHKLWEGLGYYSRVRNLKKAAGIVMQVYNGCFPTAYNDVLALPGIGAYTAGAICSIAYNQPTPAVDGNVLRIISRITADSTPTDLPAFKTSVQKKLAAVYPEEAGTFTQALMELGATVCGPNREPACFDCPCREFCKACAAGTWSEYPVRLPKRERKEEDRTVFILSCNGFYAMQKRENTGLLASMWQFPNIAGKLDVEQALQQVQSMGVVPENILRQTDKTHIFTHIQWNMRGFYIEVKETAGQYQWMHWEQIRQQAALPTAFRQFCEPPFGQQSV